MSFARMRASLVERGLIDEQHRLTAAGRTYTDELLEQLKAAEAYNDPAERGRKWDMRWRR